ncbi:MAG: 16S rRNA processing protein RimM [Alphaproteobacteria bacterium]|nr:16S rRNA processing protein RimM [Alphaproteobacteria bacterium]
MKPSNLILVGQILAAHGIKGEVKIKSFTQDPLGLRDYKTVQDEKGTVHYTLKILDTHKNALIAKVKGIADRTAAEVLAKPKPKLYVTRDQLPEIEEGRYYIEDLKGFSAISEKGKPLATLKDIQNFGAGDILVLELLETGKEFMLPFKEPFAGKVDIKKRTIVIMIPPGWLAQERPEAQGIRPEKKKPVTKKADEKSDDNAGE